MDKFVVRGGKALIGKVTASGAKNVALKAIVAACLTDEKVVIENIPLISDFFVMVEIIRELGGKVTITDHIAEIEAKQLTTHEISLENAARSRTSSMFIAPLLMRAKEALIPNPGGCRLGARPVDRIIDGLRSMQAEIEYTSDDGYFHGKTKGLVGTTYRFEKPTHTGTETLLIAAACATGKTRLENVALEPEIDELITLLNSMGAKISRQEGRIITVDGVEKLHGTTFRISPDRNEIVTYAIAALLTRGDITVEDTRKEDLKEFLEKLEEIGAGIDETKNGIRFYYKQPLRATDVITVPYPGFMTDWQAPWAVLMTTAQGKSLIHETVFESRFSYVTQLNKMGAHIKLFNPPVESPEKFYNFNIADDMPEYFHAASITGPTPLHNAVVKISDLRAGATLVLAALAAKGESVIFGVEHLDRGYEQFEKKLASLGADIKRESMEEVKK